MRKIILAVAVLLACGSGGPDAPTCQLDADGECLPVSLTVQAAGLWLTPNDLDAPPGAMAVADNVVLTRDNIVEPRRGLENLPVLPGLRSGDRLIDWRGRIFAHATDGTLWLLAIDYTGWTQVSGSFQAPASTPLRASEASQNLYVLTSAGLLRLDSITGPAEASGAPAGLDVQASLGSTDGLAVPGDSQVGYRVIWGKKDANGNLILGAPSGRGVLVSPAITAGAGALVRSGTTVTVTSAGHPFASGENIIISPGETNFPAGTKTITGVTSGAFTYTESGSAVASTVPQRIGKSTRNATVVTSVPTDVSASHFFQVYRTAASVQSDVDPGDEEGLVYEGPAPSVASITQLVRSSNVVTATTAAAHGYATGQIVRVSPGGSVGGVFCAVGASAACSTSPDGVTWTARTIPGGTWKAIAWNGSTFVALGTSIAATSPDGVTWTSRTIPAGSYLSIVWTGSLFVAVGADPVCATSPDGITWTSRTIPGDRPYLAVAWNGSVAVALGSGKVATSSDGITWTAQVDTYNSYSSIAWNGSVFAAVGTNVAATSPDGVTWTARNIPAATYVSVAWSGARFVAVGGPTPPLGKSAAASTDGVTWTAVNIPAAYYRSITWNGTAFVAVGDTLGCATSSDGLSWVGRSVSFSGLAVVASGALFSSGERVIATIPGTTSFTYAENGGNGTLTQAQTATPLTATVLDVVPSSFIGATIYTAPSQQGILQQNDRPPAAADAATYKGYLFLADIYESAAQDVWYLGGLSNGDTVTINGTAYTAGAAESIPTKTFQLYTTGTPSQNIFNTAASLIRILNRTLSSGVRATDISSPDDVPGHIELESLSSSATLTIAFSRASSWSPSAGATVQPERRKNRLRWSKQDQPDAFPYTNSADQGSGDQPILRIVPTRDSLFIFKADGLWRLTGDSPPWTIKPFDPTCQLLAPESAAGIDNQVWGLTTQGVVRISDTGVTLVSRPIEPAISQIIKPALRDLTSALSFGVGYQEDHKYHLWTPLEATDTRARQAWTYDLYTQTWTHRTDAASHGLVGAADSRLYLLDGQYARQERKALDASDYADASTDLGTLTGTASPYVFETAFPPSTYIAVGDGIVAGSGTAIVTSYDDTGHTITVDRVGLSAGAARSYGAIRTAVKWTPKYGAGPASLNHFREIQLLFRSVYFAAAAVSFSAPSHPAAETVSLFGANYFATPGTALDQLGVRVTVPQEESRTAQLNVGYSQSQAFAPMQIQALSVVFNPGSERTGR